MKTRIQRARQSLVGLSVGDAFGERFFTHADLVDGLIKSRTLPAGPWGYTDDTVMAMSVVDVLEEREEIDRDRLAQLFASRYSFDPRRGYGGTAHDILRDIGLGIPWREAAGRVFDGGGSMGNGGAMRSAPAGAYFAEDYAAVVAAAAQSAEVTHAHPEGQAGAIAVAIAAAWVVRGGGEAEDLFETVLEYTPQGETWAGLEKAARLPLSDDVRTAVTALGNGSKVISIDTVPFCIWCTARHRGNFEEALWTTVSGLGDRDTTCAIVGGILALDPAATIPAEWLARREPLENMAKSQL